MLHKSTILEDWKSRTCMLATMHGKERVIAPLLKEQLGISVMVPPHFDTDRFGTFTRDIARAGNQYEAARAKARAAIEETGADMALASEGSFGAHPTLPLIQSNLELLLLIDTKHDIEIHGHYRTSSVRAQSTTVRSVDEAVRTALAWGFPQHGVIVRRSEKSAADIHKDITSVEELRTVAKTLLGRWFTRSITLETDMRAHRCPPRMESIKAATANLIENCLGTCPACTTPGFVVTDVTRGLPCRMCSLPTEVIREYIHTCKRCEHREARAAHSATHADPGDCTWCNP